MTAPLISLLGPPASGKTTIARLLADDLRADLILEDYAGNPFLADSYKGCRHLRLAAQTWFLLSRVRQLSAPPAAAHCTVSDHAFLQDAVYARLWLDDDEFAAYSALADRLAPCAQPPQLLIHLHAPLDLLLHRIAQRGRDFERSFSPRFLLDLNAAYNDLMPAQTCPVITINVADCDLRPPQNRQWLLDEIRRHTNIRNPQSP